jgi:hypothetical protein
MTQTGYVSAINRLLSRAADLLFPCRHKHTTLPFNERQHCLDCGASRLYIFNSKFENSRAGIFMGPWRKNRVHAQAANRVVAEKLIANAIAPRAVAHEQDGRGAVLNPGKDNPLFQRRPRTCRTTLERLEDDANRIISRHLGGGSAVQE